MFINLHFSLSYRQPWISTHSKTLFVSLKPIIAYGTSLSVESCIVALVGVLMGAFAILYLEDIKHHIRVWIDHFTGEPNGQAERHAHEVPEYAAQGTNVDDVQTRKVAHAEFMALFGRAYLDAKLERERGPARDGEAEMTDRPSGTSILDSECEGSESDCSSSAAATDDKDVLEDDDEVFDLGEFFKIPHTSRARKASAPSIFRDAKHIFDGREAA